MIIVVVVVEVFLQDQINRREQRSNDSHTGISGNGFSVENESGFSYLVPYSRAHSHVIILKKKKLLRIIIMSLLHAKAAKSRRACGDV